MKITDRRWRRALAANPASKKTGASELKRLAAVRVHRFVELSRCAAMIYFHVGVGRRAASCGDFTTMPVHAKHQFSIHRQHQPEAARRSQHRRCFQRKQVRA
jgi:hypothetical protein